VHLSTESTGKPSRAAFQEQALYLKLLIMQMKNEHKGLICDIAIPASNIQSICCPKILCDNSSPILYPVENR
jgi:hypothetical protein